MAKNKLFILLIILTFTQNVYSSNKELSSSSNQKIHTLQKEVDDWYHNKLMPHFMLEGLSNNKEYLYSTIKNLKESAPFFAEIPKKDPSIDKISKDAHPFLSHCALSMFPYGCTPLILNQKIIPIAFVLLSLKRAQLKTKCNIKIDTMQTLFIKQIQTSHQVSKIIEEDIQTHKKMRQQERDFSGLIKGSKQKTSKEDFKKLANILTYRPELANTWIHKKGTVYLTPLMYAAKNGNLELINLLLAHNALINTKKRNGLTPLAYAKNSQTTKLLLERGANISRLHTQKYQQPSTKCMLEHPPFLTLKVRILNFIRERNGHDAKDKQINTALLRSIHPHVFNYPRVVDPAFEQRIKKNWKLEEKKHTVHEPTNPIDLAAQYGFYISDDDDQDTAKSGLKTKNSVLGFYVSDDDE